MVLTSSLGLTDPPPPYRASNGQDDGPMIESEERSIVQEDEVGRNLGTIT
jgi:hypothetical protein